MEACQIETASYQAQQSIGYHLQPKYLRAIWSEMLQTIASTPRPCRFSLKTSVYLDYLWRLVDKSSTGFEVVRAQCHNDFVTMVEPARASGGRARTVANMVWARVLQHAAEIRILLAGATDRLESIAVQVRSDRSDVVREQHAPRAVSAAWWAGTSFLRQHSTNGAGAAVVDK